MEGINMLMLEREKILPIKMDLCIGNRMIFNSKRNHVISFSCACYRACVCTRVGYIEVKSNHGVRRYASDQVIFLKANSFYEFCFYFTTEVTLTVYSIVDKHWNDYYNFYYHYIKSKKEIELLAMENKEFIQNALMINCYHTIKDKESYKLHESNIVSLITELVLSDLSAKWNYDKVCQKLYVSSATLYRELRKANTSLKELLIHLRLTEAATLLNGTSLPIGIVALRVGFGSSSYFCKIFKEKLNCSPNEYRNMIAA